MPLTKQDIDALVEGMRVCHKPIPGDTGRYEGVTAGVVVEGPAFRDIVSKAYLLRALYLAAGLTATGERKPERVRCWMIRRDDGRMQLSNVEPNYRGLSVNETALPGWFVPDGAA